MDPKLKNLHDFYLNDRDMQFEHLVAVVHPWESGLDNAPLWDEPLATIADTSEWAIGMPKKYDELTEQGNRPKRSYREGTSPPWRNPIVLAEEIRAFFRQFR